jgi:hypothetical protein
MAEQQPITATEAATRVLTARTLIADAVTALDMSSRGLNRHVLDHNDEQNIVSAVEEMEQNITAHLAYGFTPWVDGEDEQGVVARLQKTAADVRVIAGCLDRAAAEIRGLSAGLDEAYAPVEESTPAAPKAGV